jgi:hypothetical protein
MKLTTITAITSTLAGLLLSYSLYTSNHKQLANTAVVGTMAAIVAAYGTHEWKRRKLVELDAKLLELQGTLDNTETSNKKAFNHQLEKARELQANIESLIKTHELEVSSYQQKIKDNEYLRANITKQLETAQQQLIDARDYDRIYADENKTNHTRIAQLEAKIQQLEKEAVEADKDFDRAFEEASEKRYQQIKNERIDTLFRPYEEVVEETQSHYRELLQIVEHLKKRCRDRKQFVNGMVDETNVLLDNASDAFNDEKGNLLGQIELGRERIALLQQQLDGILSEPKYLNVGYALHGKIANDIAKLIYELTGIPLEVLGYKQDEEITRVGLGYSKGAEVESIIKTIESLTKEISTALKIHSITSVNLSDISPTIHLNFRKDAPKPESVEAIYKAGLIPASQFCDAVAKATNHKTKGKPTLRVMAATGEGKGIAVKNLLAYFADMEGWEIWLSDPLHGSEEDYWDTPKIATDVNKSGRAYELFCKLHHERHELKQPGFTDCSVLGVFDEFDKQHSDDDKENAKKIMTAIRHSQQRQILIGQCAEVGANGWAWDDMKNCSLLVLGASIGSLCKHLATDMGWSTNKKNKVKREYERYSTWADNQNANNPDVPNENQTRIALLVSGDRYQFLEVPIAHKGILKNGKAIFRTTLTATSLSINTQNSVSTNINSSLVIEDVKAVVRCPYCTSTNLSKNGKDKKTRKQLYICKDCNGSPRSWYVKD